MNEKINHGSLYSQCFGLLSKSTPTSDIFSPCVPIAYVPVGCRARGTGRAAGICPKADFLRLGFISALIPTDAFAEQELLHTHSHTTSSTPDGAFPTLCSLTHTHSRPKEKKADQREIRRPAGVLMRDGRASGVHLRPFLPLAMLSGGP